AGFTHGPLTAREQIGVVLSVMGLGLLGISLIGAHGEGSVPSYLWVGVWLACSVLAALGLMLFLGRIIGAGPAWGLAAGILFAAGGVSAKIAGSGRTEKPALLVLLVRFFRAGTAVLSAG